MRNYFIIAFCLSGLTSFGQHLENLPARPAPVGWDNVAVEKIADDSLCTSFMIWIKGGVKHHFHATHTESVYILEGDGTMELGDDIFNIKSGDYILIPKDKVHAVTAKTPLKVLSIQTPAWISEDRQFVPPVRRPHNE